KRDREILQRDFLENLIETPLQKRAVDVHDRTHAGFRQTTGERHGVAFADSRVEESLRKFFSRLPQLISFAHRCRDYGNAATATHGRKDSIAHDVSVGA